MAVKRLYVEGIGEVTLQKRRNTRSIRLHIQGHSLKVTMPHWVAYRQALDYIESKRAWIRQNLSDRPVITDGTYIGKSHQLRLLTGTAPSTKTRVTKEEVIISLPPGTDPNDNFVQAKLLAATERALRLQAKTLLEPRISDLSLQHGFEYSGSKFKKLKSRWGSCDRQGTLTFNIYLMQIPWALIDYVIVHELAHTRHHDHSAEFWAEVSKCLPNYKDLKKQLKGYHPHVIAME